jgi:hypothetical protein
VNLVRRKGSLGVDLGEVGAVLKSRDRTMNTRLIATDLASSFLASGGVLFLNTEVEAIRRHEVITPKGAVRARHVIVACGSECRRLTGVRTRVVFSPLVVVYPALTAINFVRMTPNLGLTVNHLYHKVEGLEYSVIGSALYYDADSEANRSEALETMQDRLLKVFPDAAEHDWSVYFGPKSELVDSSQLRNYQYHIIDAENATVVLPGKFSLAFSLAVNTCRHFGVEPLRDLARRSPPAVELDSIVAWPRHYLEAGRMRAEAEAARQGEVAELQPVQWGG